MRRTFSSWYWRIGFCALMLTLSVPSFADDPVMLIIHLSDGTVQSIKLYTRPQVTFEGDRVVFTSPVATFSYDAQQVLRFTYSGNATSIRNPKSEASFRKEGEQVIFDASVKASDVQLFTEDGKQLATSLSIANGRSSLSLKTLPAGVYLLKVNGRTSKIMKQ